MDEWCNIFKIQCSVQVDTTDPSLTPHRWIYWMRQTPHRVSRSSIKPSLPYLDLLWSLFPWRQLCSLAPDTICLSHSVDSSALSYMVRNPRSYSVDPSHRMLKSFSTSVQLWNVRVPSFPFVQFKFSVYGLTYADRQTDTRVLQCSHASVGLAPAHPNKPIVVYSGPCRMIGSRTNIPYSGKLLREKTFADCLLSHAKVCHTPKFCGENLRIATKPRNSRKFSPSVILRETERLW